MSHLHTFTPNLWVEARFVVAAGGALCSLLEAEPLQSELHLRPGRRDEEMRGQPAEQDRINIALIGDSACGKTQLINRITDGPFSKVCQCICNILLEFLTTLPLSLIHI